MYINIKRYEYIDHNIACTHHTPKFTTSSIHTRSHSTNQIEIFVPHATLETGAVL